MKDKIGQELAVGDYVAIFFSDDSNPAIRKISGFTPKKVRLKGIDTPTPAAGLRSPHDLLRLDKELTEKKMSSKVFDFLGQELSVGDMVIASDGCYIDPLIFKIKGFLPTEVQLKVVIGSHTRYNQTGYSQNLIKVDGQLVTMAILNDKDY